MRLREARRARVVAAAQRAAATLLASGTTAVGDIDSSGVGDAVLARHPLRARVYREVLDAADPERTTAALARVAAASRPAPGAPRGSPRTPPFTVSPALFAAWPSWHAAARCR